MDIVGTGGHKRADVAFKVGKIGGKDARGDFYGHDELLA